MKYNWIYDMIFEYLILLIFQFQKPLLKECREGFWDMSLGICIVYITKNQYCFCAYSYEIIHLIKYGSIFDLFQHLFLQELIYCPHVSRFNNCLKLSIFCPIILLSNSSKYSSIIDSSLYLMISSFDLNWNNVWIC